VILNLSGPDVDSRVVRTAIFFARAMDAVLYAIDVQKGTTRSESNRGATPRIQDAYYTLSKSGGLPDDVDVRIIVTEGEPSTELVRLANRRTDLLVIGRGPGTKERPSAENPLARDCVTNADCTVVVVPPESRRDDNQVQPIKEYAGSSGKV
jgi:nucleotide-binding universal stress UspA family protein